MSPVPRRRSRSLGQADSAHLAGPVCSLVSFRVHKADLSAHSAVFRDMLEIGSSVGGTVAEVSVTETGAVLEVVLAFCRTGKLTAEQFGADGFWGAVQVFDKYDVGVDVFLSPQ